MASRKRHKKRKKKRHPEELDERYREEDSPPRKEYRWYNQLNTSLGPSDPGIPAGLRGVSEMPEQTLAWIRMNCVFAKGKDNEPGTDPGAVLLDDGKKIRRPAGT